MGTLRLIDEFQSRDATRQHLTLAKIVHRFAISEGHCLELDRRSTLLPDATAVFATYEIFSQARIPKLGKACSVVPEVEV